MVLINTGTIINAGVSVNTTITPLSIFGDNLSAWYEPQLAITQTTPGDGNPIDTLDNIEGTTSFNLTGTTTERPTRVDGASPNGRMIARFNGTSNVLQAPGVPVGNPEHVFFVFRTAAAGSTGYIIDTISSFNHRTFRITTTVLNHIYHGGTILNATSPGGHDQWHNYEFLYNGTVAGGSSIIRDGSTLNTGTLAAPTKTGLSLGGAWDKAQWIAGDVAFLCVVNGKATAGQLDLIRTYMSTV